MSHTPNFFSSFLISFLGGVEGERELEADPPLSLEDSVAVVGGVEGAPGGVPHEAMDTVVPRTGGMRPRADHC